MRKAGILVVVSVLLLTGCGDDGDETATEDIPAPGAQSGAQSQTTRGGGAVSHDHGPGAAPQGCPEATTTLRIVANNTSFDTDCLAGAAGQELTLTYENRDQITHNLVFLETHTSTDVMFRATEFQGPRTQTFTVPPQRAGSYAFHCEFHPTRMQGTFVVK